MHIRKALLGAGLSLAAIVAVGAMLGSVGHVPRTIPSRAAAVEATGPVSARRPQVLPASLRLDGTVVEMGHAVSGTMTIQVGSSITTAEVTLPDYSVTIQPARGDDMVAIELETPGFKYASVLGSYRRLASLAGGDNVLTVAESTGRLRLSPFSSALSFFLRRTLGNQAPASDSELERALRSLQSEDLTTAAATLAAISDDRLGLPGGYADGQALMRDREAYSAYVRQNRTLIQGDAYLVDAVSVPFAANHLGEQVVLLGDMATTDGLLAPLGAQVMIRNAQGYAVNISGSSRSEAQFSSVLLPSGDMELTPAGIIEATSFFGAPNAWERRRLLRQTYRRMFVGDKFSLWAVVTEEFVDYPELPDQESWRSTTTAVWTVSSLLPTTRFTDDLVLGLRTLPVFCLMEADRPRGVWADYAAACEYALHRFEANGLGRTLEVGAKVDGYLQPTPGSGSEPFTWQTRFRGTLHVLFPTSQATYWRVDGGDPVVDGLVYVANVEHGAGILSIAGHTAMFNLTQLEDPSAVSPLGDWRYATSDQVLPPYAITPGALQGTEIFSRYADGTQLHTYLRESGPAPLYFRSQWQVVGGTFYATRHYSDGDSPPYTFGFSSCEQAYAEGGSFCGPEEVRYFRPLTKRGNRLYGIEDIYSNIYHLPLPLASPYDLRRRSHPTYYELQ